MGMMKLPLHERLCEFSNKWSPDTDEFEMNQSRVMLTDEEAKELADEIERDYALKPVDADGKAWEIGDECLYYGHEYKVVGYSGHLNVIIQPEPAPEFIFVMGCVIRRPIPQSPIEKLRDEMKSYAHSHVPDSVLDGWVKDLDAYIDQQGKDE